MSLILLGLMIGVLPIHRKAMVNMNEFIEAGVCGFGIGTNITNKKMIEENDFEGITALAKEYVAVIKDE